MKLSRFVLIAAFTTLLVATGRAQPTPRILLPLVRQPGVALEQIAVVDMPFSVYNAVQPQAVHATSLWWYISVYRTDSQAGTWLVRWREDVAAVQAVGPQTSEPNLTEPIPGGPYTNARGTIACGRDHMIYQFAWQGDGAHPKLVIGRLNGDTC